MRTFRRTRKSEATGQNVNRRRWYFTWTDDLNGLKHTWSGYEESKPTQTAALGEALEELARIRATDGTITAKLQAIINNLNDDRKQKLVELNLADPALLHRGQAIAEHLDRWRESIKADRTAKHAEGQHRLARLILDIASINRLADLNAPAINKAVAALADKPHNFAPVTRRHHRQAIVAFIKWASSEQLLPNFNADAIKRVRNAKVQRIRAALTPDEQRRLIRTAETGEPFIERDRRGQVRDTTDGMTRALVYRLVLGTGLRANEVRQLTAADFNLQATRPTLHLKPGTEKNRKGFTFTINPVLAELLRDHLSRKAPAAFAFDLPDGANMATMLRADLATARAAWIAEAGDFDGRQAREKADTLAEVRHDGKVVDFHALRKTFITGLALAGVPVGVAMKLARHSDPKLTLAIYTEAGVSDTDDALGVLPDLDPEPVLDVAKATGTSDEVVREPGHNSAQFSETGRDDTEHDPPLRFKNADQKPPVGLEPTTCGLQNRCSAN